MRTEALTATGPDELETRLGQALSGSFKPTLACVFCGPDQDFGRIGTILAARGITVFGCTTAGEIIGSGVHDDSIAVMLLELPAGSFALRCFDGADCSSRRLGEQAAAWARSVFSSPALLVLSAGMQADGGAIVDGIIQTMGRQIPLFGGLAGDNLRFQETVVFTAAERSSCGVLALVLDSSRVEVKGLAVSGWKGVGTTKTITRSAGNVVYAIDDQPALDLYSRYLNVDVNDNQSLAIEYPLLLMRDDGTFVLRAALQINPDKSLGFAGSVPEGATVQFSLMPSTEIIDLALERIGELKNSLPEVDAVLLISCKARHIALGPMIDDEVSALGKLWAKPLAGFFSYGEIGPSAKGRCDFHNHTLSLLTLREL